MTVGFDPFHAIIAIAIIGLLLWSVAYLVWYVTRPTRQFIKRGKNKRPGYINDPNKR